MDVWTFRRLQIQLLTRPISRIARHASKARVTRFTNAARWAAVASFNLDAVLAQISNHGGHA
jgi:hypothetical protein